MEPWSAKMRILVIIAFFSALLTLSEGKTKPKSSWPFYITKRNVDFRFESLSMLEFLKSLAMEKCCKKCLIPGRSVASI